VIVIMPGLRLRLRLMLRLRLGLRACSVNIRGLDWIDLMIIQRMSSVRVQCRWVATARSYIPTGTGVHGIRDNRWMHGCFALLCLDKNK